MQPDEKLIEYQKKYITDKIIAIAVFSIVLLSGTWFVLFEDLSIKKRLFFIIGIMVFLCFVVANLYGLIAFLLDKREGPIKAKGVLLIPTQIERGVTNHIRYRGVVCFFQINDDLVDLTMPKGYAAERRLEEGAEYLLSYYRRSKVLNALEEIEKS